MNPQREQSNRVSAIISISKKAYKECSEKFHDYFEQMFVRTVSVNLMRKEKHVLNRNNREMLCEFIDDCVLYRLELISEEPDKNSLLYSFSNPYDVSVSLDEVMESLVYGAYPVNLVKTFKDTLEQYITDQRIVDVIVSRLETNKNN